ncbi:MAG: regulatory protein RecX [Schaedlerella sp.]|nr:recombination regulator RecX [Lachnospiraceae bacterium]MDY4201471.1 regulatory protein RecX [Schaedlerella sp.]
MIVTRTETVTSAKYRVEVDGEFAFVLYKKELDRFGIRENEELSEETYHRIKKEVVLKRAKLRAMHLLGDMDRTRAGLREKLRQNMYPEDVIDEVIAYVDSFGYLNDDRYAENFVLSHKAQKSRKELFALLNAKGISPEQAGRTMESCYGEDEEKETICRILQKKKIDTQESSEQEMQKIYGYLARKGFRYETIRQVIQNNINNA